jgi:hypothetical protein
MAIALTSTMPAREHGGPTLLAEVRRTPRFAGAERIGAWWECDLTNCALAERTEHQRHSQLLERNHAGEALG